MFVASIRTFARVVFGWSPEANVAARETAWLDGVRGVAAFLVMMNHYNMEWLTPFVDAPFGATVSANRNPDGVNYHQAGDRLWAFWRLPVFKIFMISGGAQVSVFFVLSGMVLSWSPIGSIQAGNYEKVYHSLGSSVVRRWFRWFLPCLFASSLYMWYNIFHNYQGIMATLYTIGDYIMVTERWANPFETTHITQFSTNHSYNFVMWTVPFEFSGSIFVYVCLLGFGRITSIHRRIMAILIVSWWAFFKNQWGLWLFGHGIIVADYVRYSGGFRKISERGTTTSVILWTLTLLLGLTLMGYMGESEWFNRPGYEWMEFMPLPDGFRFLVNAERFWWGIGGFCVVLSCCHLTVARRFFETAFVQHLGKISFMLYIVHFWVSTVVALPIRIRLYQRFCPKEFDEAYNGDVFRSSPFFNLGVHIFLWIITCSCTFIVSHIMEVFVDRPCTAFGKWLDLKLLNGVPRREKKIIIAEEEQLLENPDHFEEEVEMEDVQHRV